MKHATPTDADDATQGSSRALVAIYALFALAAGSRAGFQLATKWQVAPLAYSLSAVAAAIYLLACVGLRHRSPQAWWATVAVCSVELVGVVVVGTLTVVQPGLFAAATVWSGYGRGYGFVPLMLPVLGLVWLLQAETRRAYGVKE